MKPLFLFFLFSISMLGAEPEIKSLRTYSTGNEASFPIINYGEQDPGAITIEFDIEAEREPNLIILFKFCDRDWKPYENVFLENRRYNTAYSLWFDQLPITANGARYHFKGDFPNFDVTFPFSGCWRYFIVDSYNNEKIYGAGRFVVYYPEIEPEVIIKRGRMENINSSQNALDRIFDVSVDFALADTLFPQNLIDVRIVENRKFDYPFVIDRNINGLYRNYHWNGSNAFSFQARDIKPGNIYRQVNLMDHTRFQMPEASASVDGIETSNFYRQLTRDLKGGSILAKFNNEFSQYMFVNFRLRAPDNFQYPVFLVGAFNDWQVLPEYEMENIDGIYEIAVELKRGIYDYQFVSGVVLKNKVSDIDWLSLEGNYWETNHDYSIFIFYKTPDFGGYDKLIGYRKISSGGL